MTQTPATPATPYRFQTPSLIPIKHINFAGGYQVQLGGLGAASLRPTAARGLPPPPLIQLIRTCRNECNSIELKCKNIKSSVTFKGQSSLWHSIYLDSSGVITKLISAAIFVWPHPRGWWVGGGGCFHLISYSSSTETFLLLLLLEEEEEEEEGIW